VLRELTGRNDFFVRGSDTFFRFVIEAESPCSGAQRMEQYDGKHVVSRHSYPGFRAGMYFGFRLGDVQLLSGVLVVLTEFCMAADLA